MLRGLVNLLPALDLVTFVSLFLLLVYSYLDLVIALWMLCHDAGLVTYMWLHPGLSLGFTQLLAWIRDALLLHSLMFSVISFSRQIVPFLLLAIREKSGNKMPLCLAYKTITKALLCIWYQSTFDCQLNV